jgi:L-galactose dehydrogenase
MNNPERTIDSQSKVPRSLGYALLGETSLRISSIGFGSSPLGDVFSQVEPGEGRDAVRQAIDAGINFFDVSPYYGSGLAEERLGEALRGLRDRVVLATKCGRYGLDSFDFSASTITSSLERSLRRLHTDAVDLLQAHDVEFADPEQIVHETIPALRKLQQQGKTRYVGITGYSLDALLRIASRVKVDSILTYCHCNLLISDIDEELIPFASRSRIGVINASPLHMGLLTPQGAPAWHPAPGPVREAAARIVALCQSRAIDPAGVALRYCLDHPGVTSTLVGLSTPAQVAAAVAASTLELDPALLEEIRGIAGTGYGMVWPSGSEALHV